MSLAAGESLGAYEIVAPLGAGGMGEVYLAHDSRLRRDVAIKVLPAAHAGDPDRRRRFEQEARAAAALNHPNILAIHDIGWAESSPGSAGPTPYIVMEYVQGETLSAHLRRVRRVPWTRALEIGNDIAAALAVAHARSIVHRDLKPGNVMLMPDGRAKVLDFGLAKSVAVVETGLTTAIDPSAAAIGGTVLGRVVGTPGYMSPEQRAGGVVDHRTDIYSLGVMLYELMTGRRPPEPLVVGSQVTTAERTRVAPADGEPPIPAAVCAIVERAIAPDPAARPATAEEFGDELRRALGSSADVAGHHRGRRRRWAVGAAVAAVLAATAGGAWWWMRPRPPAERPVIAVLPLANLTGDPGKGYLGAGLAETLTTALGQLSSISVVSTRLVQESAGKTTDLSKIARDVGATLLVQGSVQQAAGRVRVSTTLTTADGKVAWSGDTDADATDFLGLGSRLAGSLVDALRVTVTLAERGRISKPPTQDRVALEAYWRGVAALDRADNTDIDPAIQAFQQAITRDSQFALAHAGLGEAYRRKYTSTNDPSLMTNALAEVTEALKIDPSLADVHLSLANVYRSTGRNGAAVDELRRALVLQPLDSEAHRQLGDLLAGEGQASEALQELQRSIALRPTYWRNQLTLGLFYLRTGRFADAVTALTRVTELRPDDASAYQPLGAAYQMLGNRVRARANYERAIQLKPNPASYTNLGTIAYSEGRYLDAAQAYEEAVRLAPNLAVYRSNLGDAYSKLRRPVDAKRSYEMAVRLSQEALTVNPANALELSRLGIYEAKIGKFVDAERYATSAVGLNPSSPDVTYAFAVVLTLKGDSDRAIKQLSEAIARGYSRQLARDDDDLVALRSLPAFAVLVGAAER